MNRNIYMVFDTAAAIYMGPIVHRTDGEALRDFEAISTNAETKIGQNPEDFSLYKVGMFNDNDGILQPLEKICLGTALEMVAKARQQENVKKNVTAGIQNISAGGTK